MIIADTAAALRRLAPFLIAVLMVTVSGCAFAALSAAGPALGAGEYATAQTGDKLNDRDVAGPSDEQADRCNSLVQSPPGVEEFRMDKDGTIESRQWRLIKSAYGTRWAMVREKSAPEDGWQPKPGLSKLRFSPALTEQLKRGGEPLFLAYAPADTQVLAEGEELTVEAEVFGPSDGNFEWRGRRYSYVLVPELPCFKELR